MGIKSLSCPLAEPAIQYNKSSDCTGFITYTTETFPYGASSSPDDHYAVHIGAGQVIGCCSASHRTLILHQVSKFFAFFPLPLH